MSNAQLLVDAHKDQELPETSPNRQNQTDKTKQNKVRGEYEATLEDETRCLKKLGELDSMW